MTGIEETLPMRVSDPQLVSGLPVDYLFEFRVEFEPAMLIYPTPFGTRIDAIATRGKAEGPRFNAEVLPGGGDWLTIPADGVARMDIRATLRADTGDYVHYTSSGRWVLDPATRDRFLAGRTITRDEMYGRASPLFETSSDDYRWLNETVATGVIVELSLDHIRYEIYAHRSEQPVASTTTHDSVRRLFERYADTFATHDVEAIVALHTPDTQFWLHLDNEPVRGRAAVADAFAGFFEQWPKLGFEVYRVRTGSDHWVLDWALTAELTRPDGTPAPVRFDCVDIVTLDEDGLVVRKDTFVDYAQVERALADAAGP